MALPNAFKYVIVIESNTNKTIRSVGHLIILVSGIE